MSISILLIGLDNSGKTTMFLDRRELPVYYEVRPTINMDMYMVKETQFQKQLLIYDCSGQYRYRSNWKNMIQEVDGVIFVIDVAETGRFHLVQQEIYNLLEYQMSLDRQLPFVFMLNKMDLNIEIEKTKIIQTLGFDILKSQFKFSKFVIKETSGLQQLGIKESLEWLIQNTTVKKKTQI